MNEAKQIALLIKLFQKYPSGYIPFICCNDSIGISKNTYRRIFKNLISSGLLRTGKNGYFINRFKFCLNKIYGSNFSRIRISDKKSGFMVLVKSIIKALVHLKISQQYFAAKTTILEKKGRNTSRRLITGYLKEGVVACVRISSRQIAGAVGCSHAYANNLIESLKNGGFIMINRLNKKQRARIAFFKNFGYWECEREILAVFKTPKPSLINPF